MLSRKILWAFQGRIEERLSSPTIRAFALHVNHKFRLYDFFFLIQ